MHVIALLRVESLSVTFHYYDNFSEQQPVSAHRATRLNEAVLSTATQTNQQA